MRGDAIKVRIESISGDKLLKSGMYRNGMSFGYDDFEKDLEDIYLVYGVVGTIDAFRSDTEVLVRFLQEDTKTHFGYMTISLSINDPRLLLKQLFNLA